MKKKNKKSYLIIIVILLILSNVKVFFATDIEDFKFVQMIEGLDRKTIESAKKELKKKDKIDINGIRMYKDISSVKNDKIAVAVNLKTKVMTIWAYNEDAEEYNIPIRAIVCSPNKERTPKGVYHIGRFHEQEFHEMIGENNYCQYCMRITQNILIHSPIFEKRDHYTLKAYSYNGLGVRESGGCVRVKTGDAAWLFEHLTKESPVYIYSSDYRGPLQVERLELIDTKQNFDPTDPYIKESS